MMSVATLDSSGPGVLPGPCPAAAPPGNAPGSGSCDTESARAAPESAGATSKLGRTSPCSTSWAIQAASAISVLRPGTFRRWVAFSSQHST
jgi:hypothetical protein